MIEKENIKDNFLVIVIESISGFRDINSGKCVDFDSPKIVELALVKIENNKIISHMASLE